MEPLRKQVIDMQRKINDMLDDRSHSAAGWLQAEVQGLEDDLQVNKNPGTIEDRVKRIINLLQGEAKSARIMNHEHLDSLRKWFEGLRATLQRMR